jgi:hypothetical protein
LFATTGTSENQQNTRTNNTNITCYRRGRVGHYASNCTSNGNNQQNSGDTSDIVRSIENSSQTNQPTVMRGTTSLNVSDVSNEPSNSQFIFFNYGTGEILLSKSTDTKTISKLIYYLAN